MKRNRRMKIIGIYKITNTITGDFYIGSSKNVKKRLAAHKWPSKWNEHPNNPMYLDMKKYGTDKFEFEVLAEVEPDKLKETEQEFIEKMHPTYNSNRANGWDIERYKEYQKSNKSKQSRRKASKKYNNKLCCYNGETLTLHALSSRFYRAGIPHPVLEAKKYLIIKS